MDYELLIFVLYFAVHFRRGVPSARTNEQGHDERSITENDGDGRTNDEGMAMSLARRKLLGDKEDSRTERCGRGCRRTPIYLHVVYCELRQREWMKEVEGTNLHWRFR